MRGAHERGIDDKFVGYGAPTGPKKGVMTAAHPRTTFQCKCPPGFLHPHGSIDLSEIYVLHVQWITLAYKWNLAFEK